LKKLSNNYISNKNITNIIDYEKYKYDEKLNGLKGYLN